jgi:uncharacterized membrane protein
MLWSLALSTLSPALATPFIADYILLGFPSVMAIVGGSHTDSRHRRAGLLDPNAASSLIPFWALIDGRQKWGDLKGELKWTNLGVGVVAALGFAVRREKQFRRLLKR